MGFGFNLFGFPILIIMTLVLVITFAISRKKLSLYFLGIIWSAVILIYLLGLIGSYFNTPIKLKKEDIVGVYKVDTNFFPGENADWQHEHFQFEITEDNRFIFSIKLDHGQKRKLNGRVKWKDGPPAKWSLQEMDGSYHIIRYSPTLYRSYNKFYYVFSTDWGNMFFRKVK